MFSNNLTTAERLSRVKIQLQDEQPFWAYLILKMLIEEDTKGLLPKGAGMGVNAKGHMHWKKDFVDEIKDDEKLKFCLAHEVGHLIFGHLMRKGNRNHYKFNVASDIVLNNVLQKNDFVPYEKGLIPRNNEITVFNTNIKDIDKKTAEDIYDEIPDSNMPPNPSNIGFDDHGYGDGMTQAELDEATEKWKENLMEAAVYSKNRGKLPAGMESIIDKFMNPKYNWKQMLRKYITNILPYDYSFSRPNRKFHHVIMPGSIKETVDIVVHIDTSGSISNQELSEFMSEIIGIATSHQNLNMTLIECDAEINQVIEVNSRNVSKLRNIKIKSRGGTSHKVIWDYLIKNKPHCKFFVSLTDLYSDIEASDKPRCEVVWVCPPNHNQNVPFGKILTLK